MAVCMMFRRFDYLLTTKGWMFHFLHTSSPRLDVGVFSRMVPFIGIFNLFNFVYIIQSIISNH